MAQTLNNQIALRPGQLPGLSAMPAGQPMLNDPRMAERAQRTALLAGRQQAIDDAALAVQQAVMASGGTGAGGNVDVARFNERYRQMRSDGGEWRDSLTPEQRTANDARENQFRWDQNNRNMGIRVMESPRDANGNVALVTPRVALPTIAPGVAAVNSRPAAPQSAPVRVNQNQISPFRSQMRQDVKPYTGLPSYR